MRGSNHHPVVCYGETLWSVLPTGRQAGGAPVNIACHLQQLGMNPALISRIGYDELGKELIETLEARHICTDYFQMDEDKPTGVATAYVREGYEAVHTIYNDVAWDVIAYSDELAELISKTSYFVFGTLATRCRESYETLVKLLPVANTKVLHIHLCAPFYNRAIIETLLKQTDIAVLNYSELELITGWFSHYKQGRDRIGILQERFNIPVIAVADGRKDCMLSMNDAYYEHAGFKAKQKEAGSNEAFLAGLLAKLSAGGHAEEALEYAAATAAWVSYLGEPLPQYSSKEIDALVHSGIL